MNSSELLLGMGKCFFCFALFRYAHKNIKTCLPCLKKKQNTLMCVSVETYQPQADNVQRVIIQGRGKLKFKQSRDAFMSGFTASHLNEY